MKSFTTEKDILGKLILEPNTYLKAVDLIKPEYFIDPNNRQIFKAIKDLNEEGTPVDYASIKTKDKSIPFSYLKTLEGSYDHIENLCRGLKEAYIQTKLFGVSTFISSPTNDIQEKVSRLTEIIQEYSQQIIIDEETSYQLVRDVLDKIDKNAGKKYAGYDTGFPDLNLITGGLNPSELIIIAGRPGMGKTAFALRIAYNMISDKNVAFFSLEMSGLQLMERLLSMHLSINFTKIRNSNLTQNNILDIQGAANNFDNLKVFDKYNHIDQIISKCKSLKLENKLDAVFIDYIGLVEGDGKDANSRVSKISRRLKQMTQELNIPVVALSQLNRKVEDRPAKDPRLSDLRDSGSIEQDANIVMLMYRPEYYSIFEWEDGSSTIGEAAVMVAKNRSGSTGNYKCLFDGDKVLFSPRETEDNTPEVLDFDDF